MRFLLDTHILLWWLADDRRLSNKARQLIENQQNTLYVSSISIWEIVVKRSLGRIELDLPKLEEVISASDFKMLSMTMHHALTVSGLPNYHRDPFDRMLIAQCLAETTNLLTHDSSLNMYGKVITIV